VTITQDPFRELALIEGERVRLELLSLVHLDALCAVGLDEDLWRVTVSSVRNREEMRKYITDAIRQYESGSALPFAIVKKSPDLMVGSTRFGNIDRTNKRVEIGWTWIGKAWQRSFVNTEAKFLLLRTAFERLDCIRVEFKTDALNEKSRKALERIGATEEGTLRSHMATHDGRFRDTVYFSILAAEWPAVKQRLLSMMDRKREGGG
jgi:RimJ/RimL family protein N-acetyltransferase